MAYFDRALSSALAERARQAKCVLAAGARQVGKPTMLAKTFPDCERVSFDGMMALTAVGGDAQLLFKDLRPPVVLDEVQEAPETFRNIKIACDSSDERGRFIMTGSQAFESMRLSGESLAGRIPIVELLGLSMRELCLVGFNEPFLPAGDCISHRDGKIKPYGDRTFGGGFFQADFQGCPRQAGTGMVFFHRMPGHACSATSCHPQGYVTRSHSIGFWLPPPQGPGSF